MSDILCGTLVHLTEEDPDVKARSFHRWDQDTEWIRLLDTDPPWMPSEKKVQQWMEKDLDRQSTSEVFFTIRALDGEHLIGFIGLFDLHQHHGDALVAIALGERDYWGKGYGTDAMQVLLRYAFSELNLRRVGLLVFEYNPRAIRSYEKAGFILEGRVRGALMREGRRWDFLYMGILHQEWQEGQADLPARG